VQKVARILHLLDTIGTELFWSFRAIKIKLDKALSLASRKQYQRPAESQVLAVMKERNSGYNTLFFNDYSKNLLSA